MYVIASFQYSKKIEIALAMMEKIGLQNDQILVLPLDKRLEKSKVFDSMHQSDGVSFVELSAVLGAVFMLLGSMYGFILKWGPIIWALIGLLSGLLIGFLIDFWLTKKKMLHETNAKHLTEIIMMIQCRQDQTESIKNILWQQLALGVAILEQGNENQESVR